MIAGLEQNTTGRISIGDAVVSDADRSIFVPAERRRLGMVFQSYAIWPHMTVFDNVAYPLRIRRRPAAEIKERVTAALGLVEMEKYAERPAPALSGGQQQRVAIARALVFEPEVLLLDEPLSNLDARLRTQMGDEFRKLQKRLGITSLYVTHDQDEAMALSDRVVVMEGGKILQVGSPEEIYQRPGQPQRRHLLRLAQPARRRGHRQPAGRCRLLPRRCRRARVARAMPRGVAHLAGHARRCAGAPGMHRALAAGCRGGRRQHPLDGQGEGNDFPRRAPLDRGRDGGANAPRRGAVASACRRRRQRHAHHLGQHGLGDRRLIPAMARKLRSNAEYGNTRWATRRTLWRALGLTDEDLEKPKIAVVNSSSDLAICYSHLDGIAVQMKQAIRAAGGVAFEVRTTAPSDFVTSWGHKGGYILSARDLITNDIEAQVEGALLDGMVCLASCDKTPPGQLMAAGRLNIPTLIFCCGYQPSGQYKGHVCDIEDVFATAGGLAFGKVTIDEIKAMGDVAIQGPGVCAGMGTANTLHAACEALGMSLPGSTPILANSDRMWEFVAQAGKRIVAMVDEDLKPRDILTLEAFENAVMVMLCVSGSINSAKHLAAIAQEAGCDIDVYKLYREICRRHSAADRGSSERRRHHRSFRGGRWNRRRHEAARRSS